MNRDDALHPNDRVEYLGGDPRKSSDPALRGTGPMNFDPDAESQPAPVSEMSHDARLAEIAVLKRKHGITAIGCCPGEDAEEKSIGDLLALRAVDRFERECDPDSGALARDIREEEGEPCCSPEHFEMASITVFCLAAWAIVATGCALWFAFHPAVAK